MIAPSTPDLCLDAEGIKAAIVAALRSPELLARAQEYHAAIAADVLSRNHDRVPGSLRISDAGSCSLELWADMNGALDIPEDPKGLLRMHNGSLVGAWVACLLKAGLTDDTTGVFVSCEAETEHDEIPGHVDAVIERYDGHGLLERLATVEIKRSGWVGDWRGDCKPAHKLQSGKYALGEGAPKHFVINYYASAQETIYVKDDGSGKGGRIPGEWLVVHEFNTADTEFDVRNEYERLSAALSLEPPAPDPPEAWNCKYCRYSECSKNKNPLKGEAWKAK